MSEFEGAARRLYADLAEAGVPAATAAATRHAYERALASRGRADWITFYVAAFAALRALGPVAPDGRVALARLVRLFDDDLGAAVVAAADRKRLRARLVEAA